MSLDNNDPVIKKVKMGENSIKHAGGYKNKMEYEQAMRRLIMLYPAMGDTSPEAERNDTEPKINRYQLTQKYSFKVEVSSFFSGPVLKFPYDQHKINLNFQLEPVNVRKWTLPTETLSLHKFSDTGQPDQPQPLYQLDMPLVFGSKFSKPYSLDAEMEKISKKHGLDVGRKVNAYYMVIVNPFPTGSHLLAKELINDFDIRPFSLQINAALGPPKNDWPPNDPRHLRVEKHFETSCMVTFHLVRHIIAPMLSVLLPLWVIQLMLPFTWLMDVSPLNDAFAFLVGLLLTVTSHRGVMESKMQFVGRITDPDIEFIKTVTFLFLQMLLISFFNGFAEDFYVATFVSSDYFMFEDGLNVGVLIFAVQLLYLTLRILRQLLRARHSSNLISEFGDLALFDIEYNQDEPISLKKYAECVLLKSAVQEMVRKELLLAINHMSDELITSLTLNSESPKGTADAIIINRKTLKSTAETIRINRKTYFSYNVKLYSKQSLPSDLFRMRLDQAWERILDPVQGDGNIGAFKIAYTKELVDNKEQYGQKVVYDVIPREGTGSVQLEVQFVKPDAVQTRKTAHTKFKSAKLKKGGNMPRAYLLLWLLIKSIWFEASHVSKDSFVKICADIKLFRIAIQVRKCGTKDSKARMHQARSS
jgi:hypothetical protein